MNVGELIGFLSQYSKNTPVLLSSDEEGNSYAFLSDVEEMMYKPDATYSPYYIEQIYMTHERLDAVLAENQSLGYTEEDRAPEGAITAIVLWP